MGHQPSPLNQRRRQRRSAGAKSTGNRADYHSEGPVAASGFDKGTLAAALIGLMRARPEGSPIRGQAYEPSPLVKSRRSVRAELADRRLTRQDLLSRCRYRGIMS